MIKKQFFLNKFANFVEKSPRRYRLALAFCQIEMICWQISREQIPLTPSKLNEVLLKTLSLREIFVITK